MTTNYFAVSQNVPGPNGRQRHMEPFFFDDRRPESIRSAFDTAQAAVLDALADDGQLAVFKKPTISGPWDFAAVVGENPMAEGEEVVD